MRFTRQRARTLISTGRPNRTVWSGGRLEERRCLDHRRVVDAMARRRATKLIVNRALQIAKDGTKLFQHVIRKSIVLL